MRLVRYIAIILLFGSSLSFAAVPRAINYQGYLTDSGGAPINTTVSMTFSLYNSAMNGSVVSDVI